MHVEPHQSAQPHGGCAGNCSDTDCGGCGSCCGTGELTLYPAELSLLRELGQFAFLPIIGHSENGEPVYHPVNSIPDSLAAEFSQAAFSLAHKHLITIDPDLPLSNVSYGSAAQDNLLRCGSLALTAQGQEVLDWLPPDAHDQ